MQTEIEAKFTQIDKNEMRKRLKQAGATLTYPERLMRRVNFNGPDGANAWIRVRDEGDKVTMTYKRTLERTLHGTKEIHLVVDDYEKAVEFLETIGLAGKAIQETMRETWVLMNAKSPWIHGRGFRHSLKSKDQRRKLSAASQAPWALIGRMRCSGALKRFIKNSMTSRKKRLIHGLL